MSPMSRQRMNRNFDVTILCHMTEIAIIKNISHLTPSRTQCTTLPTRAMMFTEQPTSLLTRLEAWSKGRNSPLLLQTWLKPMSRKIVGSTRGLAISDLLNGHSKLLSTYLCLDLYSCVSPNLGQRSSYCSGSRLMLNLGVLRTSDCVCSAVDGTFISNSNFQGSGII